MVAFEIFFLSVYPENIKKFYSILYLFVCLLILFMFAEMAWNIAKDGEQKVGRYRFVNFSHLMFYSLLLS